MLGKSTMDLCPQPLKPIIYFDSDVTYSLQSVYKHFICGFSGLGKVGGFMPVYGDEETELPQREFHRRSEKN